MATTTYAPAAEPVEQTTACFFADDDGDACAGAVTNWSDWGPPLMMCDEHGSREAERFWTERGT